MAEGITDRQCSQHDVHTWAVGAGIVWRCPGINPLMDEHRVTAVVTHDDDCRHTEIYEMSSLEAAVRQAECWPLSSGYRLVSAVVEVRAVTEWTEYKKEN